MWHWDDIRFSRPTLEIFHGVFPFHLAGVGYIGASYSYLLAPGFWLAGPSTFVMDLFAYSHGLLMLWTGYLVARRFFEPPATLLALAVLAVPPLYLAHWSLNGTVNHPQVLALGSLFLVGTHSVFFRGRQDCFE